MEEIPTWMCVVALALNDAEGRWLMHRRPDHKHHGGLWEFPGGKVEPGETPANALIREIEEELGIRLDAGSLEPAGFAQETPERGTTPIVILLYTAKDWDGVPEPREGGAIAWFVSEQIARLQRPPLDVELCRRLFGRGAT